MKFVKEEEYNKYILKPYKIKIENFKDLSTLNKIMKLIKSLKN